MHGGKWVRVWKGRSIGFTQHHAYHHFLVPRLPFFSPPSFQVHSFFQIMILSACKVIVLFFDVWALASMQDHIFYC